MRAVIVTIGALLAILLSTQVPEWGRGDTEFQQQSCRDNGTC
jgi:hypothetical protein